MTTPLGKVVTKVSVAMLVTRRDAVTWVDSRDVPGATLTATVNLGFQRTTDRPIQLDRLPDGDQTSGEVRIWAETGNLAAAEDVSNPGVPLGWTELQTAPPERAEGPPGDLVDFEGRRYEITERIGWTETKTFRNSRAGFQRYVVQERGATPP